jgi:hypothetical protein
VARDARGPSPEVARARIGTAAQCENDLFEGRLHEIVVVVLTSTEDAEEGLVDHAVQAIVEQARHAVVAALDGVDDFLVRYGLASFGASGQEAEWGAFEIAGA